MALNRSPDYQINWTFGSGGAKYISKTAAMAPSWISDRNNFSSFFIYKSPRCFLPSLESAGLLFQENKQKINF